MSRSYRAEHIDGAIERLNQSHSSFEQNALEHAQLYATWALAELLLALLAKED